MSTITRSTTPFAVAPETPTPLPASPRCSPSQAAVSPDKPDSVK